MDAQPERFHIAMLILEGCLSIKFQYAARCLLHALGQAAEIKYSGKNARFKVRIPPHLHSEFAAFVVEEK